MLRFAVLPFHWHVCCIPLQAGSVALSSTTCRLPYKCGVILTKMCTHTLYQLTFIGLDVCVYLSLSQAAVNWQTHVWSTSDASPASHCSTCEVVKAFPGRPARPSSRSCQSTHSTASQMKNWSRGYPRHLPLTAQIMLRCKAKRADHFHMHL